jgi:hypothetical protein
MRILAILTAALIGLSSAQGNSYDYPLDKRPSLSMQEAYDVGVRLLAVLGFDKEYFFTGVSLWGDGTASGGGAWHLECRNTDGDSLSMSIHINNDYCHVSPYPRTEKSKLNDYKAKGYTRDGQISKEWLERERNRPAPRPRVTPPSRESKGEHISEEAEQAGAGQPATRPEPKSEGSDKHQPEAEGHSR